MQEKVLQTINSYKLIDNGEKVIVAVSGGPDSVCLLHILHTLSERLDITILAVHINHMMRGEESDADEAYTRQICNEMKVSLHTCSQNVCEISEKMGISPEEAGRMARYNEFNRFADETGADKIAVAHNRNDQAETVLMNIIRGSGLTGLGGMDFKRGRIIRPLLDIDRNEIEKYCKLNDLNPRIDSSNLCGEYTRNKVRLQLIPLINKNFKVDIIDNICRMSTLVSCDNSFIEKCSLDAYDECSESSSEGCVSLNLIKLKELHPSLSRKVFRKAISQVKGDLKGIESKHIEYIENFISNGRTGASIQLPGNIRAGISYNLLKIFIDRTDKAPVFNMPLVIPGNTRLNGIGFFIEASIIINGIDKYNSIMYNSLEQFFDYDKLNKGINIRNRCEGDVFKPYKSTGTKKLKEYFINNKIPREIRDEIPLIVIDNEVVWVIGYKISDKFKVTENTKSVLRLAYRKV